MTKTYKGKAAALIAAIIVLYLAERLIITVCFKGFYREIYGWDYGSTTKIVYELLTRCLVALGISVLIPYEYIWNKFKEFRSIWRPAIWGPSVVILYLLVCAGAHKLLLDVNYLWGADAMKTAASCLGVWLLAAIGIFETFENRFVRWAVQAACAMINALLILQATRQFIFVMTVLAAEFTFLLAYAFLQDSKHFLWKLLAVLPVLGLFVGVLVDRTDHSWKLEWWLKGELYTIPFSQGLFVVDRTKNLTTLPLYFDYLINTYLGKEMLITFWILVALMSAAAIYLFITVAAVSRKRAGVILAVSVLFWAMFLHTLAAEFGLLPISSTALFRNRVDLILLFLMGRAAVIIPMKKKEEASLCEDLFPYYDDELDEEEYSFEHKSILDKLLDFLVADMPSEDDDEFDDSWIKETIRGNSGEDELQTLRWEAMREKYATRRSIREMEERIRKLESELERTNEELKKNRGTSDGNTPSEDPSDK